MLEHLSRIPEFVDLPGAQLRALAARTRVLCIPGGRWLVGEGRCLNAYFYLLKGTLQSLHPAQTLRPARLGPLQHFYPGCGAVRSLTTVQVLRIDAHVREFALQEQQLGMPAATGAEPWLERFLNSHMMQQVPKQHWRQLWLGFCCRSYPAGSRILRQGSRGDHCYVLESGHAIVHRGNTTLCHLCPGDFFGEDALVSGRRRNADVTALEDVQVHLLDQHLFANLLLEKLVRFVAHPGEGLVLNLGGHGSGVPASLCNVRDMAMALDPRVTYFIGGGLRRDRALCALLLLQRGLRAFPLDEARLGRHRAVFGPGA